MLSLFSPQHLFTASVQFHKNGVCSVLVLWGPWMLVDHKQIILAHIQLPHTFSPGKDKVPCNNTAEKQSSNQSDKKKIVINPYR
jgi:hypothetical protein